MHFRVKFLKCIVEKKLKSAFSFKSVTVDYIFNKSVFSWEYSLRSVGVRVVTPSL